MAGSRLRDGPARARDAPNMRLEKYEPGLDEPTCQDVHMPALSIPPGQAFLVKVELSPPPATGVMGTIGQLLGGGEDDQKDPVARMFKVGRQTHPILRLENPFSTRQVQAKVYICLAQARADAEMRVAKLEEQLLDVRKQLQTAQVHADLAFRALQLGVRLGPGKSRREESEE
ncbi:hypothetical protein FNF27_05775 [Cafeteria roenbergensis]|uniref:Uncharacterized protein n=1 Tax=Cafeteria roenbergensis TaxID=33653 RepID=A0A5A8E4S7_CAFRO|nr:hypothetical protein FNF27_05775 [Cafeteria roenbergensis]